MGPLRHNCPATDRSLSGADFRLNELSIALPEVERTVVANCCPMQSAQSNNYSAIARRRILKIDLLLPPAVCKRLTDFSCVEQLVSPSHLSVVRVKIRI